MLYQQKLYRIYIYYYKFLFKSKKSGACFSSQHPNTSQHDLILQSCDFRILLRFDFFSPKRSDDNRSEQTPAAFLSARERSDGLDLNNPLQTFAHREDPWPKPALFTCHEERSNENLERTPCTIARSMITPPVHIGRASRRIQPSESRRDRGSTVRPEFDGREGTRPRILIAAHTTFTAAVSITLR